jgi:hypothetical protein
MSILLINTVGFLACSAVVVVGVKGVYAESQIVPPEEDYDVVIPLEDRSIMIDLVGLGVEIVGYFKDCLVDAWELLRDAFSPSTDDDDDDDFGGWEEEFAKAKPGKYEFEM